MGTEGGRADGRTGGPEARCVIAAIMLLVGCGGGGTPAGPTLPVVPGATPSLLAVAGGGNNVRERYSSDLWLHGDFAYTGTWGGQARTLDNASARGNAIKVWRLDAEGRPVLADSVLVGTVASVGDVEVTGDGAWLVAATENGADAGLLVYALADPARPVLAGRFPTAPQGFHTATTARINGRWYAFAARNPATGADPALVILDITNPAAITVASTITVPRTYGIHDTFVRDGLAFLCNWNAGLQILDVGNGLRGGSPSSPAQVSTTGLTAGVLSGPSIHNAWWFHNPVTSERRYLFAGQEGPGTIGVSSSGELKVLDVGDLANPREVAFFRLPGAGVHNVWMDEPRQILYAAFYNGGVVALDVSGTLSGDLSGRVLSVTRPGGDGNTYVWGVMLHRGSLYVIDFLSGLWQMARSGALLR
ncbi:MAG: hypothetical protein NW201_07845 [Gemmatimonadales bacterium]|nr:hypothetical protein [Gemmatimonadales bacterium]